MPHILFDLQSAATADRFERVNKQLQTCRPDYIARFGMVGSKEWWENYQSGFISKDIQVGFVAHLGQHPEWGEEPVVVIRTDRRDHAYDLDDFWRDPSVQVNAWISIQRFKIHIPRPSGPVTELVDAYIEALDSKPQQSEPYGEDNSTALPASP
ncbi:hypothetical protein [Haloferula sp. BvORR071]|uniref:hypothetical protein n=1 Tax=Haloferula sp. BvORR071 TaxID=1396141 RepID=UPI0005511FEA|nr:hypothetical protein [Haloferula sp. BvORR071]